MKLNVLLAKVESSTPVFRKLIAEYKKFFDKNQGDFEGIRKTYIPKEGTADVPGERQFTKVITTVAEKLEWMEENSAEHLDNVMAVEATNASGNARVELVIDGLSFGELSTLELMKLKSILEKEGLESMYAEMPVREDSIEWAPTQEEMYKGRMIFETEKVTGTKKSVMKTSYILEDPNLKNMSDTSRYTPVTSNKDTVVDLGDYSYQKFSGETTHRYRAGVLARRSKLITAINAALKEANDVQVVQSEFTAEKLFAYLHTQK